jgi:hypothetical protein
MREINVKGVVFKTIRTMNKGSSPTYGTGGTLGMRMSRKGTFV